jgi:hypothetical protein
MIATKRNLFFFPFLSVFLCVCFTLGHFLTEIVAVPVNFIQRPVISARTTAYVRMDMALYSSRLIES